VKNRNVTGPCQLNSIKPPLGGLEVKIRESDGIES
jgi:hypothetical protein